MLPEVHLLGYPSTAYYTSMEVGTPAQEVCQDDAAALYLCFLFICKSRPLSTQVLCVIDTGSSNLGMAFHLPGVVCSYRTGREFSCP